MTRPLFRKVKHLQQQHSTRIRLGGFELNLTTGEVWPADRQEKRTLLREQSLVILKMLVERQGKMVPREEIRKRLWPNDTIVNFDHSISVAIGILRRAFGDSANAPQYIETVARRGYRLCVTVHSLATTAGWAVPDAQPKALVSAPSELLGKKVSHYRVLEIIGGGGMGMVYRAEDLKLGRAVALKFLPPEYTEDPVALRRFEREARTASSLNHPNICTVYEIEEHEGHPFIVMEFLDGQSLNRVLEASATKSLPLPDLLTVAKQICDGLEAAHEKGIIHRDIKPANIFLTSRGIVKILDFGLAKLIEAEEQGETGQPREPGLDGSDPKNQDITRAGSAMGTAGYMSPEQVRGERLDTTTDIFSLGLVLYEAATGRRAFLGDTITATREEILRQIPPPAHSVNQQIPRPLSAVLAKAMEKERELRYSSAHQMRQALERAIDGTRRPASYRWWFIAAALLVAVLLGWRLWVREAHVALAPGDTVVLTVQNHTGEPVFNDAAYIALFTGLPETPYLNVLSVNKFAAAMETLHIAANPITIPVADARKVCLISGSKLVLVASLSEAGNDFQVRLDAMNCKSGQTVASVHNEAISRSQVIHAFGVAAERLRHELGEPESSIRRWSKPLELATSSSPEALQLLTDGYRRDLLGKPGEAAEYYQRALNVDPNMGIAALALAFAQQKTDQLPLARVTMMKAYNLRGNMTEPYRYNTEDGFYGLVTGDIQKRCAVLTEWAHTFPSDHLARFNLGDCLWYEGHTDEAMTELRETVRLMPSTLSYGRLMSYEMATDHLEDAKAAFLAAAAQHLDSTDLHQKRFVIGFLQHDTPAMQKELDWSKGRPEAARTLLYDSGAVETGAGHYRAYERATRQAIALGVKTGDASDVEWYLINAAWTEAEVGRMTQARQFAQQSLRNSSVATAEQRAMLAFALARTGLVAEAKQLASSLESDGSLLSEKRQYFLPLVSAATQLQETDPTAAIETLRPELATEMVYFAPLDGLYPAYLRGLAYLQVQKPKLAEAEFKKIIDHPSFMGLSELEPLSQLQLARAERSAGDTISARRSYEAFLDRWKTADSDIPIYKAARTEYAQLVAQLSRTP